MARADLDVIQSKLKLAIQNHQKLVVKMKADPENTGLISRIHHLQGEIMVLSDEQKTIVQNLRKELVKQQPLQVLAPKQITSPVSHAMILPRPPQIQTQAILLPTNMPSAFSLAVPAAHLKSQVITSVPVQQLTAQLVSSGQAVTIQPAIGQTLQATDLSCKMAWTTLPQSLTVNNNIPLKAAPPTVKPPVSRSSSPPIRVPQYHINTNKPAIQGSQALHNHNENRMPPPDISHRKNDTDVSDKEVKDIKRSYDKRHNSPEEKKKIEFMACLDLVSPDSLKELQGRRTERKRRSTANPQFTYHFEQARKKVSNYLLNSPNTGVKRPRGRPPKHGPSPTNSCPNTPDSSDSPSDWKNGFVESHITDDSCAVCGKDGEVLMCNLCSRVYHLDCINPPVDSIPQGNWSCPKCQANSKPCPDPAALNMVNSYIAAKAVKEDEKRKLQKKSTELSNEKTQLEVKSKQLKESFQRQVQQNHRLIEVTNKTRQSIDNLKNLMKAVQSS